ncbi:FtsX-like permease family protein [Pelagicoccus sp. SDUM812003]|uniref:ABC transporter permease n=1 Tax=Pelagicoccus sp. SDUM812003 TaxID=3041267 RepID=UPI0028106349|nr:FtsX-like permease family protein [Pelagicoccus sp. SDUM812003]MDQ8202971.1 FtsX-like permease family protein [Pelagicoccus sp. SDUM812003]
MHPNIQIAIRFLLAKKRSMLMSLCGIAFGVGFFIVTQAQVRGFEEFFIKTILGTDGAIRIEDKFQNTLAQVEAASSRGASTTFFVADRSNRRYVEGVEYPDEVIEGIRQLSNVASTSSVLKGLISVQSPLRTESAQAYGIVLNDHLSVSDLEEQILFGDIETFRDTPTGLLIGRKLADRLQVRVGDSLIIERQGVKNRFRISAVYETGVSDIDRVRLFMHLDQARSILRKPHGVSFLQVSLFDRDRAPYDAARIESITQHSAAPWQEREKVWLDVFKALQVSAVITVSTIIFISGLGMFNTLVMIVMEKTREIAILRSMGYSRADISSVFLWQGGIVLVLGVLIGFALGAGVTYGISNLPLRIRGIFSTDSYVVEWSLAHYFWAAVTAIIIVMFSSLAPARRAARLVPGDVIRGTSA